MKSKANFKSHPVHPILVPFPIAFFFGTLVFDALNYFSGKTSFFQTGYYLEIAGIIAALVTAVPGIIDYFFTVPPKSSAKTRATKHGLINITVTVLFLVAFLLRKNNDHASILMLALELTGAVLLVFSGWMGGTLVYRNQIGVDPRYASAGKWKEASISASSGYIEVAAAGELGINQMKLIRLNGKRIVLGRTENGYVAFDDRCTHKGGSLAGGAMICGTVQCPWHGSHFDVNTGAVKAGPAKEKISVYPLSERGGRIFLFIPSE